MELGNVAGEARWDIHGVELRELALDKRRNLVGVKLHKDRIVHKCCMLRDGVQAQHGKRSGASSGEERRGGETKRGINKHLCNR